MHSADIQQVQCLHFHLAAPLVFFLLSTSRQIIHNVNVIPVELPNIKLSKLTIRGLHV